MGQCINKYKGQQKSKLVQLKLVKRGQPLERGICSVKVSSVRGSTVS